MCRFCIFIIIFKKMKQILLLLTLLCTSLHAQNIWYVSNDGTGNGSSWLNASNDLQIVINNASDGDEIWIAQGTYQPEINTAFILNKNVSLYGGFPNSGSPLFTDRNQHLYPTVLQGNNEHVLRVTGTTLNRISESTTIDGFTITGGVSTYGGGLLVWSCNALFSNLKINNNTALWGEGGGIKIDYSSSTFVQVLVTDNNTQKVPGTDGDSGGIRIGLSSSPIFINCIIANNHAQGYIGGVYSIGHSGTEAKFYNSIIYGNTAEVTLPGGAYANDNFRGNSFVEFKNCILEDSGGSDTFNLNAKWRYFGTDLGGNWDIDPLFNSDYTVQPNSLAINKGDSSLYPNNLANTDLNQQNRFQDIIDIGVMEHQLPAHDILYVKQGGTGDGTSWANASGDLQAMIDKQMIGNVVWVAEGTYQPTNGEYYFRMRKGIHILGGFSNTGNPTLQDRDIALYETFLTSDYYVVIANYMYADRFLSNTAILDGFTLIKNNTLDTMQQGVIDSYSNAVYQNITFKNFDSAGSYGRDGSNNTFINCTYLDNDTSNGGNGPAFLHSSKATFEGCTFINNDNFGGVIQARKHSEVTVINCLLSQNETTAIAIWSSTFNIDNCVFYNNSGSAIQVGRDSPSNSTLDSFGNISNSVFEGSQRVALQIGFVNVNGSDKKITVSNSLFHNNNVSGAVRIGGGVNNAGDPTGSGYVYFTNCTFTKNKYIGSGAAGAANVSTGEVSFRNCIMYDNEALYYMPEIRYFPNNSNVYFQNSIVKGSGGSYNWDSQNFGTDLGGNLDIDPRFTDAESNDFTLSACSPAINAGNDNFYDADSAPDLSHLTTDLSGNNRFNDIVDIGSYEFSGNEHTPTTIYVNASATGNNDGTSWENAFTRVENAISIACENDEIWIAEGTYTPETGKSFKMLNKVNMYGGFPSYGNPTMNDRNWHDYETILSGNENSVFVNYFSESSPLTNETIIDGFILENGIGNNMAFSGLAGGAICNTNASPTLRNLIIRNNSAFGGTAIYNLRKSNPVLINCLLHNNTYLGPNNPPSSVILNVDVTDHTRLINCTIVDNQSTAFVSSPFDTSISTDSPHILLYNSIVYGNIKFKDIFNNSPLNFFTNVTYTNSIVEDNWLNGIWDNTYGTNGGGNINANPQFFDYYRLPISSAAIDKGDNDIYTQYYSDGNYDLQMINRFHNNIIDLGAFEFNPLLSEHNPVKRNDINIFPVPTNDWLFIDYESTKATSVKIFSIDGKEVLSTSISPSVNLTNLSTGSYILCIYNEATLVFTRKIIKK